MVGGHRLGAIVRPIMERATHPSRTREGVRALSFLDGLGAGITAMALLALVYFLLHADSFAGMYRDFGGRLPPLTRLVLHPAWSIAAPLVVALLAGCTLVARTGFRYVMVAIAALALLAVAVSYVGAYQPIWAFAGNIK